MLGQQAAEPAEAVEQLLGELQHVLAGDAGAQQQGQQFGIGQCLQAGRNVGRVPQCQLFPSTTATEGSLLPETYVFERGTTRAEMLERMRELLARVRDTTLGAYANPDVPYEHLVRELEPGKDVERARLFDAVFVLHGEKLEGGFALQRTGGGAKAPRPGGGPESPEGPGIINKLFKR